MWSQLTGRIHLRGTWMADSGDPVDQAYRALGVLKKRAPVAVAGWFEHALENFIAHGADVGRSLGLTKRARKRFILQRRNTLILEALSLCPGDGPTAKAKHLHDAIEVFRNKTWRTVCTMEKSPADWPEIQKLIFWVFLTSRHERIPASRRGLEMIHEMNLKIAFVDHPQSPCSNQYTCSNQRSKSKTSGGKHDGVGRRRNRARSAR